MRGGLSHGEDKFLKVAALHAPWRAFGAILLVFVTSSTNQLASTSIVNL